MMQHSIDCDKPTKWLCVCDDVRVYHLILPFTQIMMKAHVMTLPLCYLFSYVFMWVCVVCVCCAGKYYRLQSHHPSPAVISANLMCISFVLPCSHASVPISFLHPNPIERKSNVNFSSPLFHSANGERRKKTTMKKKKKMYEIETKIIDP